jgi:hypothetical protein
LLQHRNQTARARYLVDPALRQKVRELLAE